MKLNFREFGSGRNMVILHGLMGSLDNWQTLAGKFSQDFHVFTIDLRNHGHSPHSSEMNFSAMAGDIHEFFDDHNIDDAVIIGHSMGGKTAMHFALDFPEKVKALVVSDIAPRQYESRHDHIFEALESVDFGVMKDRKEVEAQLLRKLGDAGVTAFLAKGIYRADKDRLAFRYNLPVLRNSIGDISSFPESDKQFAGPTLFIRGGKSDYINDSEPAIDKHFPNSRIATIDAGHWIHAERPDAFYECVVGFLNSSVDQK